jgi:hypothetical protein
MFLPSDLVASERKTAFDKPKKGGERRQDN